jgi:hypothetical protein
MPAITSIVQGHYPPGRNEAKPPVLPYAPQRVLTPVDTVTPMIWPWTVNSVFFLSQALFDSLAKRMYTLTDEGHRLSRGLGLAGHCSTKEGTLGSGVEWTGFLARTGVNYLVKSSGAYSHPPSSIPDCHQQQTYALPLVHQIGVTSNRAIFPVKSNDNVTEAGSLGQKIMLPIR